MGGKSSPDPPDYAAAAQQQGQANIDAARVAGRLNNPNIFTPLGSRTITFGSEQQFDQNAYNAAMQDYQRRLSGYNQNPVQDIRTMSPTQIFMGGYSRQQSAPAPTAPNRSDFFYGGDSDQPVINERLTPEGQRLFDQQMRISQSYGDIAEGGLGRVQESLGQEFDVSGLPQIDAANFDLSQLPQISEGVRERDLVTQSILDRYQPTLNEQRQRAEDQLLLQGQTRGGEAWNTTQRDISQQENDARLAAILAGGQEQSRLYGMESDMRNRALQEQFGLYGMQSSNRNRALQEALALRQLPLSEVNALRTGSQPTLPQFQPYQGQSVGAAPIFDATQAQFGAELGASNAENAATGGLMSGLFGLGGSALGASAAAGGIGNLFKF